MAKFLKKLLVIFLISIILCNFNLEIVSHAQINDNPTVEETNSKEEELQEKGQGFFSTIVGIFTMGPRVIAVGLATGINAVCAGIAYIEGVTSPDVNIKTITPFEIFFNKVKILDINFFEIGDEVTIVNTIRSSVAAWYFTLRLIAMAILLVILLYVGVRMAISTVATDKAVYKKMLFDWVVSLVLIFLINYIIIFVININNSILDAISKNVNVGEIQDTYEAIKVLALDWFDIDSIPATIIYCMLVWQTIGLIINYFNRMLKVAFLIIISPLITLTYSIDKMGDGKAQALGNWLREFIFTVIIQLFHCIIYMALIGVAFDILSHDTSGSLAASILALVCVNFVKEAENIVRKILMKEHQDNATSLSAGTMVTVAALNKTKSLGKAAVKTANVTRQGLREAGNVLKGASNTVKEIAKAPVKAPLSLYRNHKEMHQLKKSGEYKKGEEALKEAVEQSGGHYGLKHKMQYRKEQKAKVKAETAQKNKETWKKVKNSKVGKAVGVPVKIATAPIRGARGVVKATKKVGERLGEITSNSDVYKTLASVTKNYVVGAGVGLATGSFMYGATGKLTESVGMGIAGMHTVASFKNTGKSLERNTIDLLRANGAETKEDVASTLHEIFSNPELFDEKSDISQKMKKQLTDVIKKYLDGIVSNPNETASKLVGTMEKSAKGANPELSAQLMQSTLKGIVEKELANKIRNAQKNNIQLDVNEAKKGLEEKLFSNEEFSTMLSNYQSFANEKQIYQQAVQAQEFGVSLDGYVADVTESFVEKPSLVRPMMNKSDEKIKKTITKDDFPTEKLAEELLLEINKAMDKRSKTNDENVRKQIDEQLRELRKIESTLSSEVLVQKERAISQAEQKVMQQVSETCQEEMTRIFKELEEENQGELTDEQKNRFKNVLVMPKDGKGGYDPATRHNAFVDTREALKTARERTTDPKSKRKIDRQIERITEIDQKADFKYKISRKLQPK